MFLIIHMEIKLYNFIKNFIIFILYIFYIPQLFFFFYKKYLSGQHIKIINYHDVDLKSINNFEKQIKFILKHYQNCDYDKFLKFFSKKNYALKKPLVIFSFDDGLLSHYENILPILNKYKLTGWFFIPTKYIATQADKSNLINNYNGNVSSLLNRKINISDQRHFMNWEEVNTLISQNHIVGSHSHDHVRLVDDLPQEFINDQIIKSKEMRPIPKKTRTQKHRL